MSLDFSKVNRRSQILKLVAFLGRYGHQQAQSVLSMPVTEMMEFASEVANLIEEENWKNRMETDGV